MKNIILQNVKLQKFPQLLSLLFFLFFAFGFCQAIDGLEDELKDIPEPVYGGKMTVALSAEPPTWDPTVSTSQAIARVMYRNVFEGLVSLNRNGEIEPALATEWETSADGLVWTFRLREDVMFHNGDMLESSDVVAKFERAMNPNSGHTNHSYYKSIEKVEDSTQEDGTTYVIFTLQQPDANFLYNLARVDSIIYPAELVDTQDIQPVGTGPFVFAEYVSGKSVRLEAFENFYKEGMPYLDTVVFRIIHDVSAQKVALLLGEIDLIPVHVQPEIAAQFEDMTDFKVLEGDSSIKMVLALNNRQEPLDNPLVRQALSYAIDRDSIVLALFGYGNKVGTHVSHLDPYFVDVDAYPYDPDKARALLAEAGYPDGFSLKLELPKPYVTTHVIGQIISQQFIEVGVELDMKIVEWNEWLERIFKGGDYDATVIGHAEPRDIGIYGNPEYYYHYDNPEVQRLLQEASHAIDPQENIAKLKSVANIIAEDAVNIWIVNPTHIVLAKANAYGFWQNQPTAIIDMREVYIVP